MKRLLASLVLAALLLPQLALARDCQFPFDDLNGHWAFYNVENVYCRGIVEGRSFYKYKPDEQITRAEFLKMVLLNDGVDPNAYADRTEPFGDVNSTQWFYNHVKAAFALNIIQLADAFEPNDPINRAEAVTMLVRVAGVDASEEYSDFKDVALNEWYTVYVRAAHNWGVVDGYTDGTFRPARKLSRAEAAVLIDRAYEAWYLQK